jgi:hypothetical protein
MDDSKKSQLEKSGFQVGSIADFLNLSQEEQAKIDNIIIRNGKPIGVCECLGKGKEKCKGNGWVRDGAAYQKCPYFHGNLVAASCIAFFNADDTVIFSNGIDPS